MTYRVKAELSEYGKKRSIRSLLLEENSAPPSASELERPFPDPPAALLAAKVVETIVKFVTPCAPTAPPRARPPGPFVERPPSALLRENPQSKILTMPQRAKYDDPL